MCDVILIKYYGLWGPRAQMHNTNTELHILESLDWMDWQGGQGFKMLLVAFWF